MTRLLKSLFWRIYTARLRLMGLRARIVAPLRNGPIVAAQNAIALKGGRSDGEQLNRAVDLWRHVNELKPRSIVEFGSGLSTAVLALYADAANAAHVSYEENETWADITRDALKVVGVTSNPILLSPVVALEKGNRAFGIEPTLDADFLYIDGPSSKAASGVKGACMDAINLWDRGGRPRAVVIDGRFPTVDLMRAHPAAVEYEFLPETHYLMLSNAKAAIGLYRRHTVFLRRDR